MPKSVHKVKGDSPRASDTVELGPPSGGGMLHSPSEPASGLVTGLGSEVMEASPRTTIIELPASWLERLIVLGSKMPADDGAEGALRAVVHAVAAILPDYYVGARVATMDGGRRYLYSEPPKSNEQPRSDRLFPEAAHERIAVVASGGGWLHLAGNDPQLMDDRSPAALLLDRAATIGADGVERALAYEQAAKVGAELKTLKSYMAQAEKLASLGQMAAGMVHELNNPLTSIVAYSDYMLRHTGKFEEQDAERIRRIAESANRMLRFTRDLVSYARPSSELPVPVPLHNVINRALAFCEHEIDRAGVGVMRTFDERVTQVRGKPEELAQIFVNLVTNACHAMAPQADVPTGERPAAKLTVSTELVANDTTVRILVCDTGHGIAAGNISLVFAPFFTTKGAGQGTGLGLSIVKNIVEAHHGEITVESSPESGTRFILLLPIDHE
jgi:two-component system, NtrC family, sensor kinase